MGQKKHKRANKCHKMNQKAQQGQQQQQQQNDIQKTTLQMPSNCIDGTEAIFGHLSPEEKDKAIRALIANGELVPIPTLNDSIDPLSNTRIFRSFESMPNIQQARFDDEPMWFVCGEITDTFTQVDPPTAWITTSHGEKNCRVVFYQDLDRMNTMERNHSKLQLSNLNKGKTIILMKPMTKQFLDGTFGSRFETPDWFVLDIDFYTFSHYMRLLLHNHERIETQSGLLCTHCTKDIGGSANGIRCQKQCSTVFCSETCQKAASIIHEKICMYCPVLLSLATIARVSIPNLKKVKKLTQLLTENKYTIPTPLIPAYKYDPKHDENTKQLLLNPHKCKYTHDPQTVPSFIRQRDNEHMTSIGMYEYLTTGKLKTTYYAPTNKK